MILLHLAGIRYSVIHFYSQQLIYNYLLQSKINLLNNIVFSRGARRENTSALLGVRNTTPLNPIFWILTTMLLSFLVPRFMSFHAITRRNNVTHE